MTDYYKDKQQMTGERKAFDISEYEFSYQEIVSVAAIDGLVFLSTSESGRFNISLDREDAIALAKHFKLTAEDLK